MMKKVKTLLISILLVSFALTAFACDNSSDDPTSGNNAESKPVYTTTVADFETFEDFYATFLAQYGHLIDETIRMANAYDPYMSYINPSSMYSATVMESLKRASDGYGGGVKYNNSAVLNCGLGTAVDAIMAVWDLVFENKIVTLEELALALERDWQGYEKLRIRAQNSRYKYGNGEPLTDIYAEAISKFFCFKVNGKRNGIAHSVTYAIVLQRE